MVTDLAVRRGVGSAARLQASLRALARPLLAAFAALLIGAVLIALAGADPVSAYGSLLRGALGSRFAVTQLLIAVVPLTIIGLGLALAFRARVWNIGAEGQFHLGALAGGAVAVSVPLGSALVVIPLAVLLATVAGALWGWWVGALRARWGVNEIITSLLSNYVAVFIFLYAVRRPLKNPEGFVPRSAPFPPETHLPMLPGLRVHVGIVIALLLVGLFAYVMNRTPFGFRVTAMGLNAEAAEASGMSIARTSTRLMAISGGMAGLAGGIQALGVDRILQDGISPGFGFTAIVVALLGMTRPVGVLLAAFLLSGLTIGGETMQLAQGIPRGVILAIQALFVLSLLVADRLVRR